MEPSIFVDFIAQVSGLFPVVVITAPLIALLVDFGKRILINGNPIIADDYAYVWAGGLNILAYAVLFFFRDQQAEVEGVIGQLTALAAVLFPIFLSILGSRWSHDLWKWVGWGYSHSLKE